jgi:hypothetical protein
VKQIEKLVAAHPDKVSGWYKDQDGYWINLKRGWQFWDCHCVHEWNVKDVVRSFRQVAPCSCDECK